MNEVDLHQARPRAARVRRPWLVAVLAGGTIAAGAAAAIGLASLSRTLADRPITIVQGAAELGDALEAAPFVEVGGEADAVVWALAPARCETCAAFYQDALAAIERDGIEVRIIVTAPREGSDAALDAWTAHLARTRDPTLAAQLTEGAELSAPPAADAADIEGHLEWGRAASDRIGAIIALNGGDLALPSLFWKRGPEWRALIGADRYAADFVRREL